jgi:hypothetical protein
MWGSPVCVAEKLEKILSQHRFSISYCPKGVFLCLWRYIPHMAYEVEVLDEFKDCTKTPSPNLSGTA